MDPFHMQGPGAGGARVAAASQPVLYDDDLDMPASAPAQPGGYACIHRARPHAHTLVEQQGGCQFLKLWNDKTTYVSGVPMNDKMNFL